MSLLIWLLIAFYAVPAVLMVLVGLFLITVGLFDRNKSYKIENRRDGWHTIVWGIVPIINAIVLYGVIIVFMISVLIHVRFKFRWKRK